MAAVERVLCTFCRENSDREAPATHIGAQSTDGGATVTWTPICGTHADGWNDGGDWRAPVFRLGQRIE